jgi:FtsP/CotA-like multicopper oxidase with cupredoxin domain
MSKPKNKEPEKKKSSKLTRRKVLKMGAAAGAVTVLGPTILTSRKASVFAQGTVTEPVLCGTTPPTSPATTPFLDALPIPLPAIPQFLSPAPTENANTAGGEAARAPHQRWAQFTPAITYQMEAKAATHSFHSNLLPSYIWGFNGKYPSSTILNAYGLPSIVRFKNSLPVTTTSFGRNEITVHLHNGHTGSESDGFAGDFFGTGLFKDNHYANAYAGLDAFGGIGDSLEAMRTFWFHDHRAGFTANNNYLGLNGMYFVYDSKDPGHEFNTPGSLRLPGYYGITDIPLVLTDKRFCAAANGRNEMFQVVGAGAPGGDKWVVNGKIQPTFQVRRRKYRFRILNTGPAKTWNLSLIKPDGSQGTMTVVAVDANFLEHPFDLNTRTLDIFVAMRYDVIIDFSQFPVGSKVYLKEAAAQNVGAPAPDPLPSGLAIENVLMRFDVVDGIFIPDTPPIPANLIAMPNLPSPDATFEWRFTLEAGQFKINGLPFDANRVDHVVLKGTTEEWTLRNNVLAGNWVHPVHIHFEEGRILERTTRPDPVNQPNLNVNVPLLPEEGGRRDVYPLPGQNSVRMRMQFRDFVGRYLIHCHNMNHEDNFMMVRWDIVESLAELHQKRREIAERRKAAGVSVEEGLPKEVVG